MMRELKGGSPPFQDVIFYVAAAQIPMMRELKVPNQDNNSPSKESCSPNPYDEGTESFSESSFNS